MKLKKTFIILLSLIYVCSSAQTSNDISENCIKKEVLSFFNKIERLNKIDINNAESVHVLEILDKKVLGYNAIGIYFCSDTPSRKKYILLKNVNKFKILNSNTSLDIIEEIASFLKDLKVSEEKAVNYLNECIKILDENLYKPEDKLIKKQKWTECSG